MNETFSTCINFMIDLEPQIRFMIDHGSTGDLFIYMMNLALYTYLYYLQLRYI